MANEEISQPSDRVLLVEDDEMIHLMVRSSIEAPDLELDVAESVAAARERLADSEYDAVILDLILPDGDGRSLLAELRERPRHASLPIVVLSARSGRSNQLECFRLGADEFFEKPFDPEIFAAALHRQLERHRLAERGGRTHAGTGLANRAALVEQFQALLDESEDEDTPLTIACIQLPRTDESTAETGDLNRVADALAPLLEPDGMLGVWEPEELVSLHPGATTSEVRSLITGAMDALEGKGLELRAGIAGAPHPEALRAAVVRAERGLLRGDSDDGAPIGVVADDAEEDTGYRILMVEDDEMIVNLVRHRLEREGIEVVHLGTGSALMAKLEEGVPSDGFDLILLDVKLPGMGGFEILQELKERPYWRDVKVVMLTSMGREEDMVRAFDLGATDYMLKPFSPVELVARVNRLLRAG